jgi:hypothetical protein
VKARAIAEYLTASIRPVDPGESSEASPVYIKASEPDNTAPAGGTASGRCWSAGVPRGLGRRAQSSVGRPSPWKRAASNSPSPLAMNPESTPITMSRPHLYAVGMKRIT